MLTQEKLKSLIHYDLQTGIFTRIGRNYKKTGALKSTGYIDLFVQKKSYKAHRLAWLYVTGSFPEFELDHINKNKSDNRFVNLRIATRQQNIQNTKIRKDNSSGYRGVYFCKQTKKWRARAYWNKKSISLGLHDSKELASNAYKEFAIKNHNEFYSGGL
jgi:hypothetical protein